MSEEEPIETEDGLGLRCGRNEIRDKTIGNGRNGCKNRMSEEKPMETEDGLGLRCGRNEIRNKTI